MPVPMIERLGTLITLMIKVARLKGIVIGQAHLLISGTLVAAVLVV